MIYMVNWRYPSAGFTGFKECRVDEGAAGGV
jgi:hypothetical protein